MSRTTPIDSTPAGELVSSYVIPPKGGWVDTVKKGQILRVTDVDGQQCADIVVFNNDNYREKLSVTYSRSRGITEVPGEHFHADKLTEGGVLRSTTCTPMMTIVKETMETKGIHGLGPRQCNSFLWKSHGIEMDGCLEILANVLEPYGLTADDVPDSFNQSMNYVHDVEAGKWFIEPPVSEPGDFLDYRAEMDCLVAISNCPCDVVVPVNGSKCTPLMVEIFDA